MKDRVLQAGTRGWGRTVHDIQNMPIAAPVNADQTMAAILQGGARG
jgi:dihydroorotase